MNYAHLLRGILLIAGTSIGGGVLGLPVLTSQAGFFPSLCLYLLCWLFMAATGLLFLEISLWMNDEVNIISMAQRTLGFWGKCCAWVLYLFLFYCLTLAYIVGMGDVFVDVFNGVLSLAEWQGQLIFLCIAVPLVYVGARLVGKLNLLFMLGLGVSFVFFVAFGYKHVNSELLMRAEWGKMWLALPITFTAFAYQGTIPTIIHYMERNVRELRIVIIVGSFLPFIAYAVWQWLILGIVPAEGPNSLAEALEQGNNAIHPIKHILNQPQVYLVGQFFAFFALITSFFGVALGLVDFLADGLNIKKDVKGKLLLCLLIFVPAWLFAMAYPDIFLTALGYAGGYGCALLLGLLPILMVWSGRYRLNFQGEFCVKGGKVMLVCLALFVVIEVVCELILTFR